MNTRLQCDMKDQCPNAVTHIGAKGWVYCLEHVPCRSGYEHCRRLRQWEIKQLEQGKPLVSYRPISRKSALALACGKEQPCI